MIKLNNRPNDACERAVWHLFGDGRVFIPKHEYYCWNCGEEFGLLRCGDEIVVKCEKCGEFNWVK